MSVKPISRLPVRGQAVVSPSRAENILDLMRDDQGTGIWDTLQRYLTDGAMIGGDLVAEIETLFDTYNEQIENAERGADVYKDDFEEHA